MEGKNHSMETVANSDQTSEGVFRSSRILDHIIRKMTKNPKILNNFKQIFINQPNLPKEWDEQCEKHVSFGFRAKKNAPKRDGEEFMPDSDSDASHGSKYEVSPIMTPAWNVRANKTVEGKGKSLEVGIPDFPRIHQSLELLESRIVTEADKTHFHVGQTLETAEKNAPKATTDAEIKKISDYENKSDTRKIPLFWERRIWDAPENTMDDKTTSELLSKIKKNQVYSSFIKNWNVYVKQKKKQRSQSGRIDGLISAASSFKPPKIKKNMLVVNSICYLTSSSDEDTDWEDFDF